MKTDRMKIGQLFIIEKGTLQSSKNTPGQYDFITASSDWKTHNEYTHDCEALIFAMGASGSLGRTHYANGKFIASDLCFILTPKEEYKNSIDLRFYYHYFNSFREEIVKNTATGTSKLAINITNFSNYEIDYFPIEVQRNISRKIDLTIPKINLLEHQMQNTLEDINQLKQTILQQAVQGQLVDQDPNDEPASELLKKIREEKERLIKEKKIKKEKPLPPITPEEIPYELPKGWEWVRLGDISNKIHYGYTASATTKNTGVKFLRITDIQDNIVKWDLVPYCEIDENSLQNFEINSNDIFIARTGGTIGKSYLVKNIDVKAVFASYLIRIVPNELIDSEYIKYFLDTPLYWTQLTSHSKGTGQPNVNATSLSNLLIPIPPINEQRRIVRKINNLLDKARDLEREIIDSKLEIELILQIYLKEAFQIE